MFYPRRCSCSRAMRTLRRMFNVIKVYPMIVCRSRKFRRVTGSMISCVGGYRPGCSKDFGMCAEETGGSCPVASVRIDTRLNNHVLSRFPSTDMSMRRPSLALSMRVQSGVCMCSRAVGNTNKVPVNAGKGTVLLLSNKVSDPMTNCVVTGHNIGVSTMCFRTPPCADRETGRGIMSLTGRMTGCDKPVHLRIMGFASVRLCVCSRYPRSRLAVVVHHCVVHVTRRFTGRDEYLNLVAKRDVNRITDRALRDLTTAGRIYALPMCHPIVKFSGRRVMRES